jgi:hypothetical protein
VRPLSKYERHVFALTTGIKVPSSATVALTASGHVAVEQREAAAEALARLRLAAQAR